MKRFVVGLVMSLTLFGAVGSASAAITWNWSFGGSETGQFVTDGSNAVPGTYNFMDFSVISSATGGEVGMLSDGTYQTAFSTDEPLSFVWSGSEVTNWFHSGSNMFDWWAFSSVTQGLYSAYLFGWNIGNVNDYWSAAHWDSRLGNYQPLALGQVTVTPTSPYVPEPTTLVIWSLLGTLAIAVGRRLRRKAA